MKGGGGDKKWHASHLKNQAPLKNGMPPENQAPLKKNFLIYHTLYFTDSSSIMEVEEETFYKDMFLPPTIYRGCLCKEKGEDRCWKVTGGPPESDLQVYFWIPSHWYVCSRTGPHCFNVIIH